MHRNILHEIENYVRLWLTDPSYPGRLDKPLEELMQEQEPNITILNIIWNGMRVNLAEDAAAGYPARKLLGEDLDSFAKECDETVGAARFMQEWLTDPRYAERLEMTAYDAITDAWEAAEGIALLAYATNEDWQAAYTRLREEGYIVHSD